MWNKAFIRAYFTIVEKGHWEISGSKHLFSHEVRFLEEIASHCDKSSCKKSLNCQSSCQLSYRQMRWSGKNFCCEIQSLEKWKCD